MNPYQESVDTVIKEYETDIFMGLTTQEATKRFKLNGPNELTQTTHVGWIGIFLSQFQNPLIYILLIAATIIFFVGPDKYDAFIISGVLLFNAIIGTIQEGRTSNILESLRSFAKTQSIVIRDGKKMIIDDSQLVIGDLIVLQEGERVSADARIILSNNLRVDEAVLTGESKPVHKNSDTLNKQTPVADCVNMVFKGTYVMAGNGHAIVVATGMNTEIGAIHKIVEDINTDIPLKRDLEKLSYYILIFILSMCGLLFAIGLFMGKPVQELIVMLTALFICVVPEGLPVVLTLVLVSGAYRMAKQFVLVKNLQAVEALGRTDVIVVDKTGTLTRNEMMVTNVYADGERWRVTGQGYHQSGEIYQNDERIIKIDQGLSIVEIARAAKLLNATEISFISKENVFHIKGDPTQAALFIFASKVIDEDEQSFIDYKKIYEIPFDSAYKYHAAFFESKKGCEMYVIGSPEVVISFSGGLDQKMQQELDYMLEQGLRVVAVAKKSFEKKDYISNVDLAHYKRICESDLRFLGLCGMQDAIRPEVATIIRQTREAGLQVIMATGDHQKTALHVANQVGIYQGDDESIDGIEFDSLTDVQLQERLVSITVFSRVSPDQKLRIIKLFHNQNKIVAMTGDGINDAPSLVAADLGIAMGRIGTEVAKKAADMILLNDSFANIVSAIKQGRHIFYTLRRVVLYFFATNMGEILIVLFGLLSGLPLPLSAPQILWLNLVTDGFLDVALSMEPQEKELLSREKSVSKISLVDMNLLLKMMFIAIPMGFVSIFVFSIYYAQDITHARTMTLITMAMFQWFNAWNCRSETKSVFQLGLFSNGWLVLTTLFVLLLQCAVVYLPFMNLIFKTVPLSFDDWIVVVVVSAPIVLLEELRKWFVRSRMLTV